MINTNFDSVYPTGLNDSRPLIEIFWLDCANIYFIDIYSFSRYLL